MAAMPEEKATAASPDSRIGHEGLKGCDRFVGDAGIDRMGVVARHRVFELLEAVEAKEGSFGRSAARWSRRHLRGDG